MSFFVPKMKNLLDEVVDPNEMRQRSDLKSVIDPFMEHVIDLRKFYEDTGKWTSQGRKCGFWTGARSDRKAHPGETGTGVHICRIPLCVWAPLVRRDPHLLHDKRSIYRMTRPGGTLYDYRVGGYTIVG